MSSETTLRMTPQRHIILKIIKELHSHPTADEVFQLAKRHLPHISLATVYRSLEVLSEHGMIQKLELAGTQKRFDGNLSRHYHVRCLQCGRTEDLPLKPLRQLDAMIENMSDFEVQGHRLEFMGLCLNCKNRANLKSRAHTLMAKEQGADA